MPINNINNNANQPGATGATGATGSTAGATSGAEALGRDDFMKLLVAQLKNQDPNNPLDTKDLVTQLSTLTSVEQLVTMNSRLESLETATNGMAANQSAGLIGKTVEAKNDSVVLKATGDVTSAVNLGQGADKVTVSIRNEAGRVVRTFELSDKGAGQKVIKWDGKADNQERVAAGNYRFEVDAKDKAGNPIAADMNVSGLVTGVSYENGFPELVLDKIRVPLSNVSSIKQ